MRFALIALAVPAILSAQETRHEALARVHGLAESIVHLEDGRTKTNLLMSLGGMACRYDRPAAARVFTLGATVLKDLDAGSGPDERYRGVYLNAAARCDPELAQRLRSMTEPPDRSPAESVYTALPEAEALLRTDPARAAGIASSVIPALTSMDQDQLDEFNFFLRRLGADHREKADRLFADSLTQLQGKPRWAALQSLGNYLFGSSVNWRSDRSADLAGDRIYSWRVRREGVNDQNVRAYLHAAAEALSTNTEKAGLPAVVARQLIPFAENLTPGLVPVFREASASDTVDLADLLATRPAAEYLQRAAASPDRNVRLQGRLAEFRLRLSAREFIRAREIAAGIDHPFLRIRLLQLIDLAKGTAALEQNQIPAAARVAGQMTPGLPQAVLYLGLAAETLQEDSELAGQWLTLVRHLAGFTGPASRPRLLLAASASEARIDPDRALAFLSEAVQAFNARPTVRHNRQQFTLDLAGNYLFARLRDEKRIYLTIPIRLAQPAPFHFASALALFADADINRLDAVLADLQRDQTRTMAQIAACELRLRQAFRKPGLQPR